MLDNSQSVVAGERLTPVVERRKCRSDTAAGIGQRVAYLERTLSHDGSLYEACTGQIMQRGAQHLLGDAWNLTAELRKAGRAVSDRRQNDGAPPSAKRGQGHVDATHVEPITHELPPCRALTRR